MKRRTFDILVAAGGLFLAVTLIASGVLLTWAHTFIGNEVHTQLAAQQIYFPPANSKAVAGPEFAAMRPYGGQQLTTGAQAQVYADHFIANHLKEIGGGKTYAQLSALSIAQPDNAKLAAQVATVFKGETLRGLLLNAYAFGTMGMIAGIAAIAAFIAGAVMLVLSGLGLMHARRTSPATEILSGPRHAHLPRPAPTASSPATPTSPPHPAPPVPVPHDNSRRDTPAGRLPPAAQTRGLAGHTGQAAVVMHHARPREPAGTALRVWRRLHPTEPSQQHRAASPAARELVPDSSMPLTETAARTGPDPASTAARLGDRGEAMSTRIDIPADPVWRDGPRSPSAAEIPGGARAADAVSGLGFPDIPRLELDQLLVDRADDVLATQGRLRGLLRANALVAGELSLPVVLRQIVSATRDLVGARSAALGVLGRDGGLEQFVQPGMDEELAARISEFTAENEQLAIALAAAVGAAIANARQFAESEQRRRWLDASAELTPLLLSGEASQPHALITRLAAGAADADFGTLAVPHGADQVIVTSVTGVLAAGMMNQAEASADSLAGQAIRTGKPSLVTGEGREAVAVALDAGTGPLIIVPLAAGEHVRGALMLGRLAARPGYTETDLGMAASFAGHAAVTMEVARARADQITLAQAEDHDRIAGDLHDHVIQELFALGMRMQGHTARCDPAAAERVNGYVDTVDEVIKKVRTSIFGLHHPRAATAGLPARVMEIIDEHTAQLGFTAGIRFAGPLDPGTDEPLAHDILAVTREALSNCARHAHATAVTIALVLRDGLITLDVTDNGRGLGTPARSSGLSSMRRRAERNGGTFQLTAPATGGTHLAWTARPHKPGPKVPDTGQ